MSLPMVMCQAWKRVEISSFLHDTYDDIFGMVPPNFWHAFLHQSAFLCVLVHAWDSILGFPTEE